MVPEVANKTGGSKWLSALPTGSKWVQAQPAGSKWLSALPTGSKTTGNVRKEPFYG